MARCTETRLSVIAAWPANGDEPRIGEMGNGSSGRRLMKSSRLRRRQSEATPVLGWSSFPPGAVPEALGGYGALLPVLAPGRCGGGADDCYLGHAIGCLGLRYGLGQRTVACGGSTRHLLKMTRKELPLMPVLSAHLSQLSEV